LPSWLGILISKRECSFFSDFYTIHTFI